jgi:hypothetical protein
VNSDPRSDNHPQSSIGRRPKVAALGAILAVLALAASACSPATASPTQPLYTEVPIGATPWPAGTVGQYGLHIDPSLLGKLPSNVDAYQIVEDADADLLALDDADLPKTFDRYLSARIGQVGDDNWLILAVGHLTATAGDDAYPAWVDQFDSEACSQASGVGTSGTETINFWEVDTAKCGGGPVVYTLQLQDDIVVSMFGYGPRDLGRQLIEAIYN